MKILIFCNSVPFEPIADRTNKLKQLIDALKDKHEISLITFSNENVDEYISQTGYSVKYVNPHSSRFNPKNFFTKRSVFIRNYSKRCQSEVDAAINEFNPECIIYNSISHFQYIKKYERIKKIYNCTQVTYMLLYRIANQSKFLKKYFYAKEGMKLAHIEKKAYINSATVLFSNISDLNNVGSQMQLLIPLYYIPFYVEEYNILPKKDSHNILIGVNCDTVQGNYAYKYFIENVHPYLKERFSDYELYVYGDLKADSYKDNNVHVVHKLNDEFLSKINCLFMPYKFRSDSHLLPIICMSKGIPLVGFTKSMEFINVKIKDDYCINDTNLKNLINKIDNILENKSKLNRITENAYNYSKEHYNKQMFEKNFKDFEDKFLKN